MAWDTELLNKEIVADATPDTPTMPLLQKQMGDTGVSESTRMPSFVNPETPTIKGVSESTQRRRMTSFPHTNGKITPNIGYDVIVQDEDTLSQGDRDAGDDGIIRNIQGKLNALGIDVGDVDGVIGGRTASGIQKAQQLLGLPRTGLLDRKTQLALTTLSPSQIEFLKNNPPSMAGYQNLGENVPVTPVKETVVDTTTAEPVVETDGLLSPDETTKSKAVQRIIGTKADGSFGRGSKDKLKAWQYRHNLPTTGEIDEVTLNALKNPDTYDPRNLTRSPFMQTPAFDLLKGVEGFEEKAYLGKISHKFKSGLTVGAGIDFGQHTKQALLDKGLPASLVDKAADAGWVGLNPDTIIDPNTGSPASQGSGTKAQRRARGETLLKNKMREQKQNGTFPKFSYEELAASTPTMYKPYSDAAKKDYDAVEGSGSFDALSEGTKAVLATEKYHRGETYNISSMFNGARADDPILTADGIRLDSRRDNMKAWLRKVGLTN